MAACVVEQVSSIIFVDQPIGTGFSYSGDVRDLRHDEEGVSEDMYDFFQVGWRSQTFVLYFEFEDAVHLPFGLAY